MSDHLIAVDWGTSSLRAALLGAGGEVLDERASPQGILAVEGGAFAPVLIALCSDWVRAGARFGLMSGMIGSRQGWQEAPYCACPAGFGEVAARVAWMAAPPPGFDRLGIVPGLSCAEAGVPDVMRGEETQILGALGLLGITDALCVLPGTHSKWARVEGARIVAFSTFMSGEFYAVLRRHTILARLMPDTDGDADDAAFLQGVLHARRAGSLLHGAFSARTLGLFERLPPASLPSYLSGLVIGEELRAQRLENSGARPVLIGAPALTHRYRLALGALGLEARVLGAEATWQGLWSLSRQLEMPT